MNKILIAIGYPGCGKTSFLNQIKNYLPDNIHLIKEYEDHFKPHLEDRGFVLKPSDYQEICPKISQTIAQEIYSKSNQTNFFMFEAARNVGDPLVDYQNGLIEPLNQSLKYWDVQSEILLMEIDGGNKNQLWQRMLLRHQKDASAAPPEVLNNYVFNKDNSMVKVREDLLEGNFVKKLLRVNNTNGLGLLDQEIRKSLENINWFLDSFVEGGKRGVESY